MKPRGQPTKKYRGGSGEVELDQAGEPVQPPDPAHVENDGANGDLLSRSELKVLESAIRGRFPMSTTERRKCVDACMAVLEQSRNPRHQIAAARVLVQMDGLNLEQEKRDSGGEVLNVNVNGGLTYEQYKKLPPEELVRIHRGTLGVSPGGGG